MAILKKSLISNSPVKSPLPFSSASANAQLAKKASGVSLSKFGMTASKGAGLNASKGGGLNASKGGGLNASKGGGLNASKGAGLNASKNIF